VSEEVQEAEALATDVRSVVRQFVRRLRSEASSQGLTWSQESIVSRLDQSGGLTSAELARAEGVRPQSMSSTVAALEAEGLVHGSSDPNDGRRTVLTLTDAGRAARAAGHAMKQKWLASLILQELSADERRELRRGLELLMRISQL
jgi:DNA-binding MarR family transcriptional regulator